MTARFFVFPWAYDLALFLRCAETDMGWAGWHGGYAGLQTKVPMVF